VTREEIVIIIAKAIAGSCGDYEAYLQDAHNVLNDLQYDHGLVLVKAEGMS
jgi:hypothetical protein